ncbi:MAG TPA: tetratricopeptide repeat protein, partial [Pirellula sp.]|nr:tetratricopeptide repeat protein [Pirellula sp.]
MPTLALFVVAGTGLCLGTIVAFTPLPDNELGEVSKGKNNESAAAFSENETFKGKVASVFERIPTNLNTKATREQLENLAQLLSRDFSDSAEALHLAAAIYFELKQTKHAEDNWRKCLKFSPKFAGPYTGLASILFDRAEEAEATQFLRDSTGRFERTEEFYKVITKALNRSGETLQALEWVQEGIREFPGNAALWFEKGLHERQAGKFVEAEVSLRKAIELGESTPACRNALSGVLILLGNVDD